MTANIAVESDGWSLLAGQLCAPERPHCKTGFNIVVGIDGSPESGAALAWAAAYGRATHADLCAVRVLEWPVGFAEGIGPRPEPTLDVPSHEIGAGYRNGMMRIFDEVDPPATWRLQFAEGPYAQMLVRLAENADLLVVGSRARSTSRAALTGETGRYCTTHSSRPVVVVPVEYLAQASKLATVP